MDAIDGLAERYPINGWSYSEVAAVTSRADLRTTKGSLLVKRHLAIPRTIDRTGPLRVFLRDHLARRSSGATRAGYRYRLTSYTDLKAVIGELPVLAVGAFGGGTGVLPRPAGSSGGPSQDGRAAVNPELFLREIVDVAFRAIARAAGALFPAFISRSLETVREVSGRALRQTSSYDDELLVTKENLTLSALGGSSRRRTFVQYTTNPRGSRAGHVQPKRQEPGLDVLAQLLDGPIKLERDHPLVSPQRSIP